MQRLLDAKAEGLKLTLQGSTLSRIRNTKRELHTPLCVHCAVFHWFEAAKPGVLLLVWQDGSTVPMSVCIQTAGERTCAGDACATRHLYLGQDLMSKRHCSTCLPVVLWQWKQCLCIFQTGHGRP